jgi:large subunit ribosomal protein L22
MNVKATLKNIRISPQKARLVADLVRGMKATEAVTMLRFTDKKAADPIMKLIKSAVHNATHNFNLAEDKLVVAEIQVGDAPTLKRIRPRSRGQADRLSKRTSNVYVTVKES